MEEQTSMFSRTNVIKLPLLLVYTFQVSCTGLLPSEPCSPGIAPLPMEFREQPPAKALDV